MFLLRPFNWKRYILCATSSKREKPKMKIRLFFVLLMMGIGRMDAYIEASNQGLAQKIDAYLQEFGDFTGAVLVAKRGEIVLSKGYGHANDDLGVPNTPQTKFRIASLTKPFTAMAIMQLQEQNLLSVQDPLSKYIPDYPNGDQITIHHLLMHSSGVQNYHQHFADIRDSASVDELVRVFKHWPLDFEPGSQFRYSNSGYVLLAHIIETVSGKKYGNFLKENIFDPLGMNNSGQDISESVLNDHAIGYAKINHELQKVPSIHSPITLIGNGDLYSSVEDLFRWDLALEAERIVGKKSLEAIFNPHVLMEGSSTRGHGYGWFVDECPGKRIIEYSGALRGFLSKYVKFIDDQVTIIMLTNVEVEDRDQFFKIYDGLAAICYSSRLSYAD
jgi:CubicO group peptidase (beta-lactamase class C family)